MTSTFYQCLDLFFIRIFKLLIRHIAIWWVLNFWRNTGSAVCGPNCTSNQFPHTIARQLIGSISGEACCSFINLKNDVFKAIITLRNCCAIESVCLNNVSTSFKISLMNGLDDLRLSQNEQVIIILKLLGDILEAITFIDLFILRYISYLCNLPLEVCTFGFRYPWHHQE